MYSKLPPAPNEIEGVILAQRDTPNGLIEFKVRTNVVRRALVWLKQNHRYYFDIEIDEQTLSSLPTDGDYSTLLPSFAEESITNSQNSISESFVPTTTIIDQEQQAHDFVLGNISWPEQDSAPIDKFTTEGAVHNNNIAKLSGSENAQGLHSVLYLSVGCRVMLRKNLWVEKGLVNGAIGTVLDTVYDIDKRPPALPLAIMVRFDRFQGPYIFDQAFPILPATAHWKENDFDCSRRQFPLTVSHALTIHKAQGITADKVVVNIGEREMTPGLSYVALSRVKTLQGLLIDPAFNEQRINNIQSMKHVIQRENFMRSLSLN